MISFIERAKEETVRRKDQKLLDFESFMHDKATTSGCKLWFNLAAHLENFKLPTKITECEEFKLLDETFFQLIFITNVSFY